MSDLGKFVADVTKPFNLQAIGVPWFTAETYPAVKTMSSDGHAFADTFDEWLANAERKLASEEFAKINVVRVNVDPIELLAFCRAQKCEVNSRSRAEFAAHKLALRDNKQS